jgi:hypothetical protein
MSPYVRTVKTASGPRAVQIVHSSRKGSRDIEHVGSAHSDAEVALLKATARQRLAAGQGVLDLGLEVAATGQVGGPLPITASRMGHLVDSLTAGYQALGLGAAAGGDEVFWQLTLARIIEPTSKLDSIRVLDEAGMPGLSRQPLPSSRDFWRMPAPRNNIDPRCEPRPGAPSSDRLASAVKVKLRAARVG